MLQRNMLCMLQLRVHTSQLSVYYNRAALTAVPILLGNLFAPVLDVDVGRLVNPLYGMLTHQIMPTSPTRQLSLYRWVWNCQITSKFV